MQSLLPKGSFVLIAGDILILALVTVFGFASHNELGTAGFRMLATFLPLVIAWFLIAPWLRVFDPKILARGSQLWRPFWAMILAAPMAAFLRAMWLNSPILPVFVVVLGGMSALSILVWRAVYWAIKTRMGHLYG